MRFPLDHGNGYKCDSCNKIVNSWEIIHIKALVLNDSTGKNKHIGKCDLCHNCYDKKFSVLMQSPRRAK